MDVDRVNQEFLEGLLKGTELTKNALEYLFENLSSGFSSVTGAIKERTDKMFIDGDTNEGKQRINNLLRKHKSGIQSLDDNLSKEQVKDYQKEMKKLGVDFSVVKNGKENYSFFFAGSQAGVIEKAIKNVVERNSELNNNIEVKEKQLELDYEMNELSESELDNVKNAYKNKDKFENLTDKEKSVLEKMEDLDETKAEVKKEIIKAEIEEPTEKQLILAEKLGVENYEDMNKKEISLALEKAGAEPSYYNNKETSKELLNDKLSKLNDDELKLFEKRIEYEDVSTSPILDQKRKLQLAGEFKDLQNEQSKEVINKINNLDKDIRQIGNGETSTKLSTNEILSETKKHSSERQNNKINQKKNTFSMENVKKIDKNIKKDSVNKVKVKEQSL